MCFPMGEWLKKSTMRPWEPVLCGIPKAICHTLCEKRSDTSFKHCGVERPAPGGGTSCELCKQLQAATAVTSG